MIGGQGGASVMEHLIGRIIHLLAVNSAPYFDFFRRDPCQSFGIGLDQSNPFCWGSPEAYLALGAVLLGFGAVAVPVAVGCRRLGFPTPNSIVIAGALAAYAYPAVTRSASLRELLALTALCLAVLIPLYLTWVAIKFQIHFQFIHDS